MDMPNWDKDPVRHGRTINEILQVYHKERKIREIYILTVSYRVHGLK